MKGDDGRMDDGQHSIPSSLVGDGVAVPCVDGQERRYLNLDSAASANALPAVARRVEEFLPWYSSVHRGAGYKSRQATNAYEEARLAALRFAGRLPPSGSTVGDDIAVIVRNTTEAINHLAYRLPLAPDDVVVTTVVEHHAMLLPWGRRARRRFVECGPEGTFSPDDVVAALDASPRPKLLAITGASNVTGWLPPLDAILAAAREREIPVVVDAAQLAPHRPLPPAADYIAWSAHKMYAPFGAGVLIGPRATFAEGDPFLAGGGAVDLVDLDEVSWTDPPEREEAGSPNVIGAVALDTAFAEFDRLGWKTITEHDDALVGPLRSGLAAIPGVRLLELSPQEVAEYRAAVLRHDRREMPGAVRASAGLSTSPADIGRFLDAVAEIAGGKPAPVGYVQDPSTGDFWPEGSAPGWTTDDRSLGASCARG